MNVRSPARLMRARSGALPFVPRAGLLDGVREWMAGPEPFSGYLVGGKGGSGKTRLGVQLCQEAGDRSWLCGLLSPTAEQAAVEALAEVPTPRLIVVDYAETRIEQMEALLPALAATATTEQPVRVLLLVRAAPKGSNDWSATLRAGAGDWLDGLLAGMSQQVLDDQPLLPDERAALFSETAAAFAARHVAGDSTQPNLPNPPAALSAPAFATPLLVVTAAYLTVHGERNLPLTREGLLAELNRHEDHYWQSTATGLDLDIDLRARIVALATLAGADSEPEAVGLLQLLPDLVDATAERRGRLARWTRNLYPGLRWWNRLEPDLLGEHLVAAHLGDFPAVLAGVLKRTDPAALVQPLELYARAAPSYPNLESTLQSVLSDLLILLCGRAASDTESNRAGSDGQDASSVAGALHRLIRQVNIPDANIAEALDQIPLRPDTLLSPLALVLLERLSDSVRAQASRDATHRPYLARLLNDLSNRYAELGQSEKALGAINESVSILEGIPASRRPSDLLAMALNNQSNRLAGQARGGLSQIRLRRALALAEEAASTYKTRHASTGRYGVEYAGALMNLANRLEQADQLEASIAATDAALPVARSNAVNATPEASLQLAGLLNNWALRVRHLPGRDADAAAAAREAVTIMRTLVTLRPTAYEPRLATCLNTLSVVLADGQPSSPAEAFEAATEAVVIRRRLQHLGVEHMSLTSPRHCAHQPQPYKTLAGPTMPKLRSRRRLTCLSIWPTKIRNSTSRRCEAR